MFEEATIIDNKGRRAQLYFCKGDTVITKDSSRKLKACWRGKEEGREEREERGKGREGGRFLSSGRPDGRIGDGVAIGGILIMPFSEHDDMHRINLNAVSLNDEHFRSSFVGAYRLDYKVHEVLYYYSTLCSYRFVVAKSQVKVDPLSILRVEKMGNGKIRAKVPG